MNNHPSYLNQPTDQSAANKQYCSPQMFVIGTAVKLLQSYQWGGYQDTYTGYYWNR